jgi:hypothetical protein
MTVPWRTTSVTAGKGAVFDQDIRSGLFEYRNPTEPWPSKKILQVPSSSCTTQGPSIPDPQPAQSAFPMKLQGPVSFDAVACSTYRVVSSFVKAW